MSSLLTEFTKSIRNEIFQIESKGLVYNTQNHWVRGFCSPCGIVTNWETQRLVNWICQ
jgi:hypothetical protein